MPVENEQLILHVDDDDASAYLFHMALEESGRPVTVHRVRDGREAIDLLGRADARRPALIVLDLSMPMMDGWELMKSLRGSEELHRIPIFVLSTSDVEDHRTKAFELGASEFVTKPLLIEDLHTAVKNLCSRFLAAAK